MGTPTRRGYRSGHRSSWRRTWYAPASAATVGTGAIPSEPSPATGHRLGMPPGGSLTTAYPPAASNGAPHSATTAGGPKLRATTTSNRPRQPGARPTTSARASATSTRSSMPSWRTACRRYAARRTEDSTSSHEHPGKHIARGRPGKPAPLPRSAARSGHDTPAPVWTSKARPRTTSTKPAAWSRWASTGPGPRKPRSRASASQGTSRSQCSESASLSRSRSAG